MAGDGWSPRIGHVCLRVADLERSLQFYQGLLGFEASAGAGDRAAALALPGSQSPLVILRKQPGASPRPRHSSGLYHYALRLPGRRSLGRAVLELARRGWPFEGFSDHGVSEAVYLQDPDGNGLELYVDRPRETWELRGGEVTMRTVPLNLDGLLRELGEDPQPWAGLEPGTVVGHIHLHVSDLAAAEGLYRGILGLEVTNRRYPGALFLAADGYHHHVAVNTWAGVGAPAPPAHSVGLHYFAWLVSDPGEWQALHQRLAGAGVPVEQTPDGLMVTGPDGIRLLLPRV